MMTKYTTEAGFLWKKKQNKGISPFQNSVSRYTAKIKSVGGYLPTTVLNNKYFESIIETSEDWIWSRTGIRERRILKDKKLGSSFMGANACIEALTKANFSAADVDCIVCATITPDYVTPATANLIASRIGAIHSFGFDLNAACSGFIYALSVASSYISAGIYKHILVVGVDKMSTIVDYSDRNTCVLFGDGAGAVLLGSATSPDDGIMDFDLHADGSGEDDLKIKAGGSVNPASNETVSGKEHFVRQNGKKIFKIAVSSLVCVVEQLMKKNNLTIGEIDWLIPHQANMRILQTVSLQLNLPLDKVLANIEFCGNTTAATIPLCLWQNESKLKKGDKIIMPTFGGGYTWGGVYMIW